MARDGGDSLKVARGRSDNLPSRRDDKFRYVRGVRAACGLVIGQEYADSAPPKITFHGHPRRAFQKAAYQIGYAFRDYPQFRSLSVHDLDSYMAARE
jgi:hypothetical protein